MTLESITQTILSENGLFAVLAVGLIIWQSKTNQDREKRYIETINNITVNVSEKINNVENDIHEIKETIKGGNRDVH